MLPTEQFSGDATEDKTPWTPQVWRDGPDALVQQAQQALFQNRADVEVGALGTGTSAPAMDGTVTQPANESDQLIDPSSLRTVWDVPPCGTTTCKPCVLPILWLEQ